MPALDQKQLRWRCRRGVRELDLLLSRFLETDYPELDEQQQEAFARFLEIQDPVIMDWLFDRTVADDPQLHKLVQRLQASYRG